MKPKITVWITKTALTTGIQEVAASTFGSDSVSWESPDRWQNFAHIEGKDWYRSLGGAIQRAEVMRAAKIKSLEKQIAKLKAMKFN